MLAVLALESHRQRCVVIGEDLGTVPDGFRERMREENILSYRLFYFERHLDDSLKAPGEYPVHGGGRCRHPRPAHVAGLLDRP